jgi:nucleotide-binding universal stress UspA family protein
MVHAIPAVTTPLATALDGDIIERLTGEARQRVHHLLAKTGARATVCVPAGDPAEVIPHTAEKHHASLLVIGRGAMAGGLGRLRAHSYSIINQAPCPVLSV